MEIYNKYGAQTREIQERTYRVAKEVFAIIDEEFGHESIIDFRIIVPIILDIVGLLVADKVLGFAMAMKKQEKKERLEALKYVDEL